MKKIVIIVAMKEELDKFSSVFEKITDIKEQSHNISRTSYKDLDIIIVVSGIGKSAASSAITAVLENHKDIDLVLNIGTAGALGVLKVGNTVVSNLAGYGDVDVTAFGYELGQLPGQPKVFKSAETQNIVSEIIKQNPNLDSGLVVTVDSFIANKEKVLGLKNIHSEAIVIDMEFAAIAQVCSKYKKGFISLKMISDNANEEANVDFKNNLAKESFKITTILPQVLNNIK